MFARSFNSIIRRSVLCQRYISKSCSVAMPIKVGDQLPEVDLYEGAPDKNLSTKGLFGTGKSVIFGVPGAFTPGCSKTHLPGFVDAAASFKAKGVKIACISVNDPFVMEAWGKAHGADGKVQMLSDRSGKFTKAIDLEIDATDILGNVRSKRYSMVVENGKVKELNVEPDGLGLTCSLADKIKL